MSAHNWMVADPKAFVAQKDNEKNRLKKGTDLAKNTVRFKIA